jgi:hypothetical protein
MPTLTTDTDCIHSSLPPIQSQTTDPSPSSVDDEEVVVLDVVSLATTTKNPCTPPVNVSTHADGRFYFFEVYARFSPLYQQVGKCLLSMKSVGSMDVEHTAKPFKHCILTKDRNRLPDAKGLLCSGLGRISSISIMPAELSRERCMQELSTQTPHMIKV